MTTPAQIRIPATYIRGGTSKGVFFRLDDLPEVAQVPGTARDNLLLRVIGSPDQPMTDEIVHVEVSSKIAAALGGGVKLEVDLEHLVRPPTGHDPRQRARRGERTRTSGRFGRPPLIAAPGWNVSRAARLMA